MASSATAQAEAFYQRFKINSASIEAQISALSSPSLSTTERASLTQTCLATISALSDEVKDAMVVLPAYDQRNYAQRVRELSEKLEGVRASVAPKAKFSFKGRNLKSSGPKVAEPREKDNGDQTGSIEVERAASITVEADVHDRKDEQINLPGQGQSCVVRDLQGCTVFPARNATAIYSTATIKAISRSTLDFGTVNGPVHVTDLSHCTIFVACRQLRMHGCTKCNVILWCGSRPIIEHCSEVAFAPLSDHTVDANVVASSVSGNRWDQVDDFGWLRPEPSPNWTAMGDEVASKLTKLWQEILLLREKLAHPSKDAPEVSSESLRLKSKIESFRAIER